MWVVRVCISCVTQAVAAKLRTSSRRTAELEVALKEHVEQEGKLQSESVQLEEKLTRATETFREKLHKCNAALLQLQPRAHGNAQVYIRRCGAFQGRCQRGKQRV